VIAGDKADSAPNPAGRGLGEVAVLANPVAGRGRHGGVAGELLERLAAAGVPARLLDAPDRDAALAAAKTAVEGRPAALVAVGGDGTVHLALQAVAGTGVPLGVVPIGTGNDFAGATGLPTVPHLAVDAVTAALTAPPSGPAAGSTAGAVPLTRTMDLARAAGLDGPDEPVWYATVLSAGLDASINERANRMRWPKGPRRYDISVLVEILVLRPHDYTLVLDGERTELPAMLIAVGNTTSYGGGVPICPGADHADGLLDLTVIDPIGRPTAIRINGLARRGTHLAHPKVRHFRARSVEIHGPAVHAYADGERAAALPLTITCVPAALHLLDHPATGPVGGSAGE
jgi:diacylglycerol kinase (ATP)